MQADDIARYLDDVLVPAINERLSPTDPIPTFTQWREALSASRRMPPGVRFGGETPEL